MPSNPGDNPYQAHGGDDFLAGLPAGLFREAGYIGLIVEEESGIVADANILAERFFHTSRDGLRGRPLDQLGAAAPSDGSAQWQAPVPSGGDGSPNRCLLRRSSLASSHPGHFLLTIEPQPPALSEDAPVTANKRVQELLSSIPDAVLVFDSAGNYRQVFTPRPELLARPAEQLIGRSLYDMLPQHASSFRRAFSETLDKGAAQIVKYDLDLNGRRHWFAARIAAVDLAGSAEPLILSAIQDITELEATREKLTFRLHMENLVFSLATRFLAEGRKGLTRRIRWGLDQVFQFSHTRSAFLLQKADEQGGRFRLLHEATIPFASPLLPTECLINPADFPSWTKAESGETVEIRRDSLPKTEKPHPFATIPAGMKLLTAPLRQHDELIGVLGFIIAHDRDSSDDGVLALLQLSGAVFSSALSRLRNLTILEGTNRNLEQTLLTIRRRDAIMGAVNFAAENFLRAGEWRSAMPRFLSKLAAVADAGSAFLAEITADPPGGLAIRHLWPNDPPPKPLSGDVLENLAWIEDLKRGQIVWTQELPEGLIPGFAVPGSLPGASILLPILVDGKWWGLLGIASGRPKHDWTGEELDALNTAGELISAALHRERQDEEINAQRERIHAVEKISAIGKLAGGIAHDFNNILTIIMGYSDLMIHQVTDSDQPSWHRYLTEIQEAGSKAQRLTRELLSYGRQQTFSPKVLDLGAFVGERLETYTRVLRDNISVIFDPSPDSEKIYADGGQLEQVLVNLIMNAADAIEGDGWIRIRTEFEAFRTPHALRRGIHIPAGKYALLTVGDNGCGIEPDILSRIFDPFFTTKPFGKGSGMGLPMVSSIMEQNHGYVDVDSTPGKGTTFRIYFPVRPPRDVIKPEVSHPRDLSAAAPRTPRGQPLILVVEDAAMVRQFVVASLIDAGYSVRECRDGAEAFQLYNEESPGTFEALVSDVVMPKMDGVELARRIRLREPTLPVVFMTGYSDEILWSREHDGGHVECLLKPFSSKEMLERLAALLEAAGKDQGG